eukprot:gb/GFBE01042058.1/.p1 GENE.gb/GFBE01042058.1/~~gb/GFBE01042058.1/.p1  ORF type:complete len:485 (+),score=119.97 gb/GFBE01042058.1/:1-1455(+)
MALKLVHGLTSSTLMLLFASGLGAEYEWAGIFDTPDSVYMWTAQKVEGEYADPAMKLVALPATGSTATELGRLEADGKQALTLACTEVTFGDTIIPEQNRCYQLKFKQDAWQSLFMVDTSSVSAVAFFAEHVPTEFESTAHYLKDREGTDIEPGAELPEKEEHAEAAPYGDAIGAAILVNLVTLTGVIMLAPGIARLAAAYEVAFKGVVFAFAAGALLSCAFFLLLFEATHLVAEGWTKEVDILWRWGTMILAGFAFPAVIDNVLATVTGVGHSHAAAAATASADGAAAANEQAGDQEGKETGVTGVVPNSDGKGQELVTRVRLVGSILIGDFFHNLCDGFFLGAAFKGCGAGFGWGVAAATILHEIPQELADYAVLTSEEAALSPVKALALNFISGLSVMLGAVIILTTEVGNAGTGLLLAFGGGVYLHVGATDCMPHVYNPKLSAAQRFLCFGAFTLGAVLIGLILIGHEHCVPEDGPGHHH